MHSPDLMPTALVPVSSPAIVPLQLVRLSALFGRAGLLFLAGRFALLFHTLGFDAGALKGAYAHILG